MAFKLVAIGRRGFPDVGLFFPGGQCVLVELKTPTGRLRPQQVRMIKKLSEQGVIVYVCNAFEEFERILERHAKMQRRR